MGTDGSTITVVLADDHAVVRSGLRLLLERTGDLEVVSEAGTAEDAVRTVLGHKPAVLVLDLNMPGELTSLDAIPRVAEASPATRVVVLTMQEDPEFARRPLRGRGGDVPHAEPRRRLGRCPACPGGAARRPERARGRGAAPHRPRPHERRDRRPAVPVGPHGRVAPRAHPAEAAPQHPRGARALRARPRPARELGRPQLA